MRLTVRLLFGLLFSLTLFACNKFSKIEKSNDVEYKLKKADEYYANKKYSNAATLYEQLFPAMKGTEKFEDLCYKYAYCFYYRKEYESAENQFKFYLDVFPNSPRAEEMDYMRAYSYFKQSPKVPLEQVNTVKAMNMMQVFINTHPGSPRIKEANDIIDLGRKKLEEKDAKQAKLYYNIGQHRAAGLAYNALLNTYPESPSGEEYKLMAVKSYFRFAQLSIPSKQAERYEQVTAEYLDFADRFPESKFLKEAEDLSLSSQKQIKAIIDEQTTSAAKLQHQQ